MASDKPVRLAVFASGRGSNARAIIEYFQNSDDVQVALILTNKAGAGVLDLAEEFAIPSHVTNREEFRSEASIKPLLEKLQIDFIALAGFLWLVPTPLLDAYPDRIVNIHPALLPAYGGKGMHGMNVHQAVKAAGEKESGITVHYINSRYDEGAAIFQASVSLSESDSADVIAAKVLKLEHYYFPRVLDRIMMARQVKQIS